MEELAATSDDAVRAYARSLAARPMTLAIVGPADRVDRAALERIAPVQELTLDTITRH